MKSKVFVPNHSGEIAPLMPISSSPESTFFLLPERVELTVNSKKKKQMDQWSRWAAVVEIGC